jgi:hypothetical protein
MVKIIIVAKKGQCRNLEVKKFAKELLYKKCKFRKKENFKKEHTWQIETDLYISLFAKDTGKAGSENKHENPPPIDSKLYFGEMALVSHSEEDIENDTVVNLALDNWKDIYANLMGGFEDLDSEEDSEEEYISPKHLTDEGYSKEDGFIVDNDMIEEADDNPDESSESSECETTDTSDSELSEEEYEKN